VQRVGIYILEDYDARTNEHQTIKIVMPAEEHWYFHQKFIMSKPLIFTVLLSVYTFPTSSLYKQNKPINLREDHFSIDRQAASFSASVAS
jgi:hypothetical protein